MTVISYKCPNCDGELIFDPASGQYKCEYCGTKFSQEELDALAPETPKAASTEKETEEAVVYTCPSCGAEIVTDATTAATFCYYCHNPVVLGGRLEGKFLPDKIIPFKIDKKEAEKRFLDYVGKKKFVPKAFFNKKQIECLSGIYFPYWLYDVELKSDIQGEAKRIRVWRTKDKEFTETKFYQVEREGKVELSNLSENALQKANAKLANGVMPYQFDEMKEFTMGYLSGFYAEKRDIEKENVTAKMQGEMRKAAEHLMRETIEGYDSVSIKQSNFNPLNETFSYVLFPVWTITYKGHNGKVYYYSMNGQTGNVCGELPIDYKKVTLVSMLGAAATFALALIGGFFL